MLVAHSQVCWSSVGIAGAGFGLCWAGRALGAGSCCQSMQGLMRQGEEMLQQECCGLCVSLKMFSHVYDSVNLGLAPGRGLP